MTTQMTIFFDKPETRCQFLKDIEGLIVYHDQERREEEERMNYEDTLSFYMPDLDKEGCDPVNESWFRMNLLRAEMAANSSHYYHFVNKEV